MRPKMGEIHYVSGDWDVNIVVHEVMHALIHRMRYLPPDVHVMMNPEHERHKPLMEEPLAYEAGEWSQAIYTWLSKVDRKSPTQHR